MSSNGAGSEIVGDHEDSERDSVIGQEELARCILAEFNYVSVKRFHKLAFLSEHMFAEENNHRLTNAVYDVVLDGCYSENLQQSVSELDGVLVKEVRISGDSIKTFDIVDEFECRAPQNACSKISHVVDEYGDVAQDQIDSVLENIDLYQSRKIGDELRILRR